MKRNVDIIRCFGILKIMYYSLKCPERYIFTFKSFIYKKYSGVKIMKVHIILVSILVINTPKVIVTAI